MTTRFEPVGDGLRMRLEPVEVELLRSLRDGLHHVLVHGDADDAVLARLFPRAVADDDRADRELRDLLHDDLLQSRLAGLDALVEVLDRGDSRGGRLQVDLEDDEPVLVLGVLNDLRLSIGARLGFEQLERRDRIDNPAMADRVAVMDHLAGLQEELLAVLDPPSVSVHDDLDPEDLA